MKPKTRTVCESAQQAATFSLAYTWPKRAMYAIGEAPIEIDELDAEALGDQGADGRLTSPHTDESNRVPTFSRADVRVPCPAKQYEHRQPATGLWGLERRSR